MACRSDTEIPGQRGFQYTIAGNQATAEAAVEIRSRHRGASDNRLASDRASGPRHATSGGIHESQRSIRQHVARSPLSRKLPLSLAVSQAL